MTFPETIRNRRRGEQGGITIMVSLMLLVLLTIAAVGMSRNSFREILIAASTRQGTLARNVADSGIEYGILWMQPSTALAASSGSSAEQLQSLSSYLLAGQYYGKAYNLDRTDYTGTNTATPPSDLQVPAGSGNGFNLALTAMGKMPMVNQSQTAGSTSTGYTPAAGNLALTAPDIWALRSDAVITVAGTTFTHSKEAWISSPSRQ
jgi:Tfp pilus assembly protein PilX